MRWVFFALALTTGLPSAATSPIAIDFESGPPPGLATTSGSALPSPDRFKSGSHSLAWTWQSAGATLVLPLDPGAAPPGPKAGFAFWCHNSSPAPVRLGIELLHEGKRVASGWFHMDYRGWRVLGAGFAQIGLPAGQSFDSVRLTAPDGPWRGPLHIDDATLLPDHSARRTLQTPWADVPDGLHHPESVILSAEDPSIHRPWLPKPPPSVSAEDLAELRRLEASFLTRRTSPGKGVPPAKADELRNTFSSYQIRRTAAGIRGRPIDGGSPLKPAGFIPIGDYLKTCEAAKNAYHQAGNQEEADAYAAVFIDLTEHLLDQGWAPGVRLAAFDNYPFPAYSCFHAMKDVLEKAGLARPVAQALMDNFASHGPGDFVKEHPASTMDGLGYWHRELPACSLMFPTPREQLHHLSLSLRFLNLALVEPNTIAPDGCTYHHGGFHFAYASYNMPRLLQVLEKLASTRFRIDAAAHERLRVFVRALAFTSSRGEQACNLGMRAGTPMSTMGVEPVARMLARMGRPGGDGSLDPEMAAISLRLLAENGSGGRHPDFAKEPWKSWIADGIRPASAPRGFLAMNGGPVAIHRGEGWLASIAGMTSRYRCIEIYGWTQTNNYGRYARNGSLFVTSTGSPPDFRRSGWSYDGWNWCHFPGSTAIRHPHERDLFDGYAMYGNSSAHCGGTPLGDQGVWGMEHSGSGLSFRKSYFCFGNRITAITTDIRPKDAKNPHPLATTLFQNRIELPSESVMLDDGPSPSSGEEMVLDSGRARWLIDNKQTGYLIPAGNAPLHLRSGPQQWRYMIDKQLVDPARNPISNGVTYQNVRSRIPDLGGIEECYRPTEGTFALAWFNHGPSPAGASATYTLVIRTTPDEMKRLAAQPAHRVLQADGTAHVVHDLVSGTFAYAIHQPSERLTAESPLQHCDPACFVMLRRTGGTLECSLARTTPGTRPDGSDACVQLTIEGDWSCGAHPGITAVQERGRTKVTVRTPDAMPVHWTMSPPAGRKAGED